MATRIERFREKIKAGETPFGLFITMSDMSVCEMAGLAGYDFVWIDAEHGPLDRQEIFRLILAAQAGGAAAVVRVPGTDPFIVKAILDMGPDGIIFPFINNAEIARRAMQSCCYPPDGIRGQGPIRAIQYGLLDEGEYIKDHKNRTLRICQIETVEGYENLDEIMAVNGIDSLFIGAADLSRSIAGKYPNGEKTLDEIYDDICRRVRSKGIILGAAGGTTRKDVLPLIEKGVQWLVCGQDARILSAGMRDNLRNLRGE